MSAGQASGRLVNVVPLRPADHIPEMLRRLADNIESGDEPADEVFCIRRHGIETIAVYDWGEYRGSIACLGLLEAAKKVMPMAHT